MTKKVNHDDLFVSSMLDAIDEIYCRLEDMRDVNNLRLEDRDELTEFEIASFSAQRVLIDVMISHLEDMEQDLKENVPLASHTYTYGYNITGLKNGKDRK